MASKGQAPKKPGKKPAVKIPEEQWSMPVSYGPDDTLVSLRDYVDGTLPALSWSQLTPEQRAELTALRIELRPTFDVATIGAGILDKKRAIAEVRAQTPLGRNLIEIEGRLINNLIEAANRARQEGD